MGLIQDLQGRKLTGCRGCDAVRKGLYKGWDLWKSDSLIQTASTHDSFDASNLGAFIQSPLKARGGGVPTCQATATNIIEDSSSSAVIKLWGNSNFTLNAGYYAVSFELLDFAPNDEDKFADTTYAHLATGASSGNTHDFTGTMFNLIESGVRHFYRANGATDVYDLLFNTEASPFEFKDVHWEIRYQNGASGRPSPFWQDGETVNIPCLPGVTQGFSQIDRKTPATINPASDDVAVCGEGDIRLDDFAFWYKSLNPVSRATLITNGVTDGSYWANDNEFADPNVWIPLDNVVVEPSAASFTDLTSTCFRRQAFTQVGEGDNEFFRIKQLDAADGDGRVSYECDAISTELIALSGGDGILQLVPA